MRIDYNYRKIFDGLDEECEPYKEMLIIMKQIYFCYSSLQSFNCKTNPVCPYIDKLSSSFTAASILLQYFYVLEAIPLIRIQVETISKKLLPPLTKEDLSDAKIEKIKEIFKIKGDMFQYIISNIRKSIPKDHFAYRLYFKLGNLNFNTFSHSNLRDDLLGLQNDDLLIEDYVLYYDFNNHPFPYGREISIIFYTQIRIILLMLMGNKNLSSEMGHEIKKVIELIKKFAQKIKHECRDIKQKTP